MVDPEPNPDPDEFHRDLRGPVLIGGDGRSGTTLMYSILDSHPDLHCFPELHFNGCDDLKESVLDGTNRGFITRCTRAGVTYDALCTAVRDLSGEDGNGVWMGRTFSERCDLILHLANVARGRKPRWGMKIMKEIANPERYLEQFEYARFICMVRDPRDVYASQKQWDGSEGTRGSWGYKSAEEAARGFLKIVQSVKQASADRITGPLTYAFFRYEDFVTAPVGRQKIKLAQICAFLGLRRSLAIIEDMLSHHEHDHALVKSHVSHYSKSQIQKPVNASAVGRWKDDLSSEDIDTIHMIAGDEMQFWGYV